MCLYACSCLYVIYINLSVSYFNIHFNVRPTKLNFSVLLVFIVSYKDKCYMFACMFIFILLKTCYCYYFFVYYAVICIKMSVLLFMIYLNILYCYM